jgi:hypothetical protein
MRLICPVCEMDLGDDADDTCEECGAPMVTPTFQTRVVMDRHGIITHGPESHCVAICSYKNEAAVLLEHFLDIERTTG